MTTEYLVLRQQSDLPKASELAERHQRRSFRWGTRRKLCRRASLLTTQIVHGSSSKGPRAQEDYLEELNFSILSRIQDYRLRISAFLDRRDVVEHIRLAPRP